MVASLPVDSATAIAEHGDEAGWGIAEQLLALVCELLDRNNRQIVGLLADGKDPKVRRFLRSKPLAIPRPGVDAGDKKWRNRRGTTLGELLGMMGGKTEV
jgi:hypothetical protein